MSLEADAQRIARHVALRHADIVDREGRFPAEAVSALREAGLLGAAVPLELGGQGAPFETIVAVCHELGKACGSTAMVFAMHQIQVACLVRHGMSSPWHRAFLSRVAGQQLLLASATTEAGSGGDVRRSQCTVIRHGDQIALGKAGCVISYAQFADAILMTARRTPESAEFDQVLLVAERGQCRLEQTSRWDALGMRGTCSDGYALEIAADAAQVLHAPYAEVAAQTMLPVSHITWAALWLGIATAACSRARAVLRRRSVPGASTPPAGAARLVEALAQLQSLRSQVADAVRRFDRCADNPNSLGAIPFALTMNQLKLAVSGGAITIVGQAMLVAGLAGYRNDSPDSLGRHLRDIHSAALMIGNDRIIGNCAALLAAYRGEETLYP